MNPEFQDKLTKTFPWFNTFIECGDGWNNLIWNLCREIDDAYFNLGRETEIMMIQCKEKFGELRFYYGHLDKDNELNETVIADIIEKYRLLSTQTCEICGEDGRRFMGRYAIQTRCERCK